MLKEDGTRVADGYEALREYDSNADGVINADDKHFKELKVWKDKNSDGITDEGELVSLTEAGVSELSLDTITSSDTQDGNVIALKSSYTTTDGEVRDAADVKFAFDENTDISAITESDEKMYFNMTIDPIDKDTQLNFTFKGEGDSTDDSVDGGISGGIDLA
jgi:hypothetical protein